MSMKSLPEMSPPEMVLAAGSSPPAYLAPTVALIIAAFLIGYLSVRVRVVPIVGFLLAGVLIGPNALELVERQEVVEAAADIGVILLLFTIGLEFSLERLARIRRLVLVGGGLQVALTIAVTVGLLAAVGVGWRDGLFTGFLVALSSTAIALKLLSDSGRTGTLVGQTSLALLVFQDLAVILMVLLVPLLGTGGGTPGELAWALAKAAMIIALVLVLARHIMPPALERVARTCSPEVFLLAIIAICLGTAFLTALAGVSVSLGAFLAGLVVSESRHSEHALGEILPLQILFSAAFFVSVGMLLDLRFLLDHLPLVAGMIAAVLLIKVAATTASLAALRVGAATALSIALLLAQVGEFSFVLETVGRDNGLSVAGLGADGTQALIAATVLLMVATPALAAGGRRLEARLSAAQRARATRRQVPLDRATAAIAMAGRSDGDGGGRAPHVVLSGWGEAARWVTADLSGAGVPFTVITLNPDGAGEAEARGYDVVRGDSTKAHVLRAAGVPAARLVVVAEDDAEMTMRIASIARGLNAEAVIVVRPLREAALEELAAAGVDKVVHPRLISHSTLAASVLAELDGLGRTRGRSPPAPSGAGEPVDVTRLVNYRPPPDSECPHISEITPVLPSAPGCEDCLRIGSTWVHLRICLSCGYVGCCDSSPNRHARAHHGEDSHPLVTSAEQGETWAYCFLDDTTIAAPVPAQ
jgi:CPA2 family monovalent cation:H+ antiporter-2